MVENGSVVGKDSVVVISSVELDDVNSSVELDGVPPGNDH